MGSLRTVSRCGAGFPDTVHARSLAPSAQCAEEVHALLELGNRARSTHATAMNARSSRSHAVFSIRIALEDEKNSLHATMHMVDLAGSERSKVAARGPGRSDSRVPLRLSRSMRAQ